MNELKDRLKFARERLNLSQADVAMAVGMKQPSYFQLEAGKTKKSRFSYDIARFLEINPDWLINGNGEMLPTYNVNNRHLSISNNSSFNQNFGNTTFNVVEGEQKIDFNATPATHLKEQILLSEILFHEIKHNQVFALRICDDYLEPVIANNAIVIAEKNKNNQPIYNGKIYVLDMQGMIICRYLEQMSGNRIKVFSEKDKQGEIISKQDFENEYQIMGRVIWQSSFL